MLLTDGRIGSQEPTLEFRPEADDFTLGQIALDWAAEAGYVLDPWQAHLVLWTFARRNDGLWAARDIYGEVPRQNGKNIWLEVVQLVSLLLFGDTLHIHSAHRADTSHEHFLSLQTRILDPSSTLLQEYIPKTRNRGFYSTNGNEAIEFVGKQRLLFKCRAQAMGRGPRPQKLFLDEALILEPEQVGTVAPGISAQPNPQVVFATSPPMTTSTMAHRLRKRAERARRGDRFFAAIWNNTPDVSPDDLDSYYRVNPSLGLGRLTMESLMANRELMTEEDFIREHQGVPDEPPPEEGQAVIPEDIWLALKDPESEGVRNRQWAVAVSKDRKWATIGVAAVRSDGRFHVEWKERKPGVAWVVSKIAEIAPSMPPIRIFRSGPEGSLIDELAEIGVETQEIGTPEMARHTASFIDAAWAMRLAHLGQPTLDDGIRKATLRTTTEGATIWSASTSDAVRAVTVALGGVFVPEPEDDEDWYVY